jgi:vancomycin resistance protein YoaR
MKKNRICEFERPKNCSARSFKANLEKWKSYKRTIFLQRIFSKFALKIIKIMHLVVENINAEQKKAFTAIAKAMNLRVKIQKESLDNTEKELKIAMKNAQLAAQGKYPSRPIEFLLNEIPD